jgi:hypothetical protein
LKNTAFEEYHIPHDNLVACKDNGKSLAPGSLA